MLRGRARSIAAANESSGGGSGGGSGATIVSLLHADGDASDSSLQGNDHSASLTAVSYEASESGFGQRFKSTGTSQIALSNIDDLDLGAEDFFIEVRCNLHDNDHVCWPIYLQGGSVDFFYVQFKRKAGSTCDIRFYIKKDGSVIINDTTTGVSIAAPDNIIVFACDYDGTTLRAMIDGTVEKSANIARSDFPSGSDYSLAYQGFYAYFAAGSTMDELAIMMGSGASKGGNYTIETSPYVPA